MVSYGKSNPTTPAAQDAEESGPNLDFANFASSPLIPRTVEFFASKKVS